jgi:PTH1 family peptidyl-tRNA hydrolase
MKLVVGLGNPGKEYEHTRHNVGFQCVDVLRAAFGFPEFKLQKKFHAETTEGNFSLEKFLLVKPQTFMNASGKAVSALVHFYRIALQDLWLIYDDVDLPLGKIRVRREGSAGSHNGMKSVIASLGFQNFPRVRIGIESRGASAQRERAGERASGSASASEAELIQHTTAPKKQDISSFVLSPFTKKEKPKAEKAVEAAAQALKKALEDGMEQAMEKYN